MKTIIIGNGILACSIAYRLSKESAETDEILIVGNKNRENAASSAAPAMLNSFAEVEKDSLKSKIDLYKFRLSIEATKAWPGFKKEVNADAFPEKNEKMQGFSCGTYVINNCATDDLEDESYNAIIDACVQFNEKFSHVSPSDIPNYDPEQKYRATRALYIDNEGWVNPLYFIDKLDIALSKKSNVKFIHQNVIRINCSNKNIKSITTSDGKEIEADQFILANGASATDLLKISKIDLEVPRVFYGVGMSIEIRSQDFPHSKCIRTPNRGLACGLYTAPYVSSENQSPDHIIVGASNFISAIPNFNGRLGSLENLVSGAIEQINRKFYRAEYLRTNIGMRPTSQDTYPLIGKTSITNLIIVTGTKREGFHLSPIISDKIVKIMQGKSVENEFNLFKPERKLIHNLTRNESIEKSLRHLINAEYQHGFQPSKNRLLDKIKSIYRDDLEKLHDQVGADNWGIPPEMIDMYRYGHAKV